MTDELDPFHVWCNSLPAAHWAKYDISACRLAWDTRQLEIDRLKAKLMESQRALAAARASEEELLRYEYENYYYKRRAERLALKLVEANERIKGFEEADTSNQPYQKGAGSKTCLKCGEPVAAVKIGKDTVWPSYCLECERLELQRREIVRLQPSAASEGER